MPKSLTVNLFEICDSAFLSRENKLSIIGMFDQIFSDRLPFNYLKFSLVSIILGPANSKHTLSVQLKDSAGSLIFPQQSIQIDFGSNDRTNFVSDYGNIQFKTSGLHTFELVYQGKVLASKNFYVTKVSSPESPSKVIN